MKLTHHSTRVLLGALCALFVLAAAPVLAGHGLPYHGTFQLDGSQENPPVASDLGGNCVAILAGEELFLSCTFTTAPMAAHIHRGSIGENGPVIFTLPAARIIQTSVVLTEDQATAATVGDLYVNFHTAENPGGEIRGQIIFRQVEDTFSMIADGSGLDEATPNASDNSIQCRGFAAEGTPTNILSVQCTHDVPDATAAHLHLGAAGVAGPVIEGFDAPTSPLAKIFNLDDDQYQAFFDGNLYINVHNAAFPGGIVRAQLDNAISSDNSLALQDGRFEVTVTGSSPFGPFVGRARELSDTSGTFSFFSADNQEVLIKVLDFCSAFNTYGVFFAATTDTQFALTVFDTATGTIETYNNTQGTAAVPVIDFGTFNNCTP